MFEAAELGQTLSDEEFEAQEAVLRTELLQLQMKLRSLAVPVIVVLEGDDRLGCNAALNRLHEWLDARFLHTVVYEPGRQDEAERPGFWRYWMGLPKRGRIGIVTRGWAMRAMSRALRGEDDATEQEAMIQHIRAFEQTLAADGAVLVKFWLHQTGDQLRARIAEAEDDDALKWSVTDDDRELADRFDEAMPIVERTLRRTGQGDAMWTVVESADKNWRDVIIAGTLRDALRRIVEQAEAAPTQALPSVGPPAVVAAKSVLDTVDLTETVERKKYKKKLDKWQDRLRAAAWRCDRAGIPTVLVFEGWDAAGKGGTIRRMTRAMDASLYRVIPISAPTPEELAHHYLWRFWRQLPRDGRMTVFDRSWYGRVLVERVEGYARPSEWRRAYGEINDFEEQLVEHGAVLEKFWLHISPEEQLARFEARAETPFKAFKITDEDWRNREKWDAYRLAADEMVEQTSTPQARWHLVPSNDKKVARLTVIKTVVKAMEARLQAVGG